MKVHQVQEIHANCRIWIAFLRMDNDLDRSLACGSFIADTGPTAGPPGPEEPVKTGVGNAFAPCDGPMGGLQTADDTCVAPSIGKGGCGLPT